MSMSCPNGRKEFNNNNNDDNSSSSGRGKAINHLGLLGSLAPACDPTIPNDDRGVERSEHALPEALAASGIPRIVVLDENAVYDHYMRRLNRVWMKRIKASRGKGRVDSNNQHSSSPFCKLNARPTSVPLFIREMDPVVHPRRRRTSASGGGPEDYQVAGQHCTRARSRPKSAPVLEGRPTTPAWAEVRDRNRAAVGPGPTSSAHRRDVGGVAESNYAFSRARPDSAPNLQRRPQRDATLSSLEHYNRKRSSPTRLAPRVARLERETHGLLTDCRKAARTRNDIIHGFSEKSRHARNTKEPLTSGRGGHCRRKSDRNAAALSESNERIENLGRGAVVRLVGSLGMGRYAHRFRAFAVTGSDLVSCTEEDLVQIGVSFRPHRIRLMKEIEQRKRRSSTGDAVAEAQVACEPRPAAATNRHDALSRLPPPSASELNTPQVSPGRADLVVDSPPAPRACPADNGADSETQVACEPRPISATNRQDVFSRQPPPSASKQNTPQVSPGRADLAVDTPPAPKACPASDRADSSSTSTTCTAYTSTTPIIQLPSTGEAAAAGGRPARCAPPEETREGRGEEGSRSTEVEGSKGSTTEVEGPRTEVEGSEPLRPGRKRSFEQEEEEGAAACPPWEAQDATKDSCAPPNGAPGGATDVAPLAVSSDASAERRIKTPRLKNTLEVSDVGADDVKAVLGGRESFLRVRMCDQLQQVGTMTTTGKALEVSWSNAVLSFSVTERDLATRSIHIELCGGGGSVGAQDLIASGAIPGEVTLCRLRAQTLEQKKCYPKEGRDRAVASSSSPAEPAAIGGKVVVGVRLFATAGGGDVGVCTLNLKLRPDGDGDDEPAREALENADQSETPAESMQQENVGTSEHPVAAAAAVPSVIPEAAVAVEEVEAEGETEVAGAAGVVAAPNEEESRHHLLLLEEAARHIETIEEACQLVRRQHELLGIPDALKGSHWTPTQTGKKAPHSAPVDARKIAGAGALLPRYRHPSTADERDAVVVLQSQCRRRAARKVAKRRAKERRSANKASQTRQRELLIKQQRRRDDAAVKLQSNARRRISVKVARRRRDERDEERSSESCRDAAIATVTAATAAATADPDPVPGFTNNLLPDNSRREQQHRVVTKVQGDARACEANAQAAQREADVLEVENASIEKTSIIEAGSSGRSEWWDSDSPEAVKLQTNAKAYAATKAVDYLRRATERASLRQATIAAEKARTREANAHGKKRGAKVLEARNASLEKPTTEAGSSDQSEWWESDSPEAVKLQTSARAYVTTKAVDYLRRATETASLRQASIVAGKKTDTARIREANPQVTQQREENLSEPRNSSIQKPTTEAGSSDQSDWWESDSPEAVKLKTSARSYAATKTVDYLRRGTETESLRQASIVAGKKVGAETKLKQREADVEVEQHRAALGIQRVARSKQAHNQVATLRQKKRDADNLRARQLELELELVTQQEAAERIQCLARSRRANQRVATLRKQREFDTQRDLAAESAKQTAIRKDAVACVQRASRSRQARLRVTAVRQERDAEVKRKQKEAEMEAERHRAALGIQRVARSKQASDHVAVLRERRDADNLRARQLEVIAQQEAAERIQCLARSHRANERVATLRRQREIDTQRDLAAELAKQTTKREDAAACVQRAGRGRQARLRVTAARRERDADIKRKQNEAKMEAVRHNAALSIQRVARSKQASDHVAGLRQKRDADNLRARQLELELELVAQREAAERIQCLARSYRANERVATLRKQREIDAQRDLAAAAVKKTATERDAASCIQRAGRSRQARLRINAVRRERVIEVTRRQKEAEMEAERHHAALGIQCVARSKQASDRVAVLRQKRDADNLRARKLAMELELISQREAAERIQCLARSHRANERVATLRQQREIDTQRKLEVESAKQTAIREDAAACIQRLAKSRRARLRVTAARRAKETEIKRKQKEAEMEAERHHAALGIQLVARSKQASDRVTVLRQKRDAENQRTRQLELELELIAQREASERIQRLARSHRAVERVATLRQQKEIDDQRHLAAAKQTVTQRDSAACIIQRLVRSRQARLRTAALRKQREIDARGMVEEEEEELGHEMAATQEKAAACIQRSVKTRQTAKRVSAVRGQREVDDVQDGGNLELVSPSQGIERVVDLRQEQDSTAKHGEEVEVEVEVGLGVRGEGVQQGRGLREEAAAAEKEPESMSSMFARMMETARKSSVVNIEVAVAGLETTSSLPQQHADRAEVDELTGLLQNNVPPKASNVSAESNRRFDDDEDAEKERGERGGSENKQVVRTPDSSGAFDRSTSVAAGADGNGLLEHGAQIERVRRSSSSESVGWGEKSSDSSSDTEASESSDASDDSEDERETRGALPPSDADNGGRTRLERYSAPSGVDEHQHSMDRENNVHFLESTSVEDISPAAPAGGVTDEVMNFGEGGNFLSEESLETADSASLVSAVVVAPERDSLLKGDSEPQSSRGGRSADSAAAAALSLATVGDKNTADRNPQPAEPIPHDDEQEAVTTHRSGSDLPAAGANNHDDHGGSEQFPAAEHDVMENWESHLDEETERVYYYHAKSGVTSWDHPRGGTGEVEQTPTTHTADEGAAMDTEDDVQGVSLMEAAAEGRDLVAAGTVTEIQPLEAEWAAGVNGGGDGRQQATLETHQHESDARGTTRAEEVGETIDVKEAAAAAAAAARGNDQSETATEIESFLPNDGKDGKLEEEEEVVQSSSAAAVDEGVEAAGKGEEEEIQWEEIVDPDSGHKYFYNPTTRQSTWALPEGVLAIAAANAAAAVAAAEAAAAAAAAVGWG